MTIRSAAYFNLTLCLVVVIVSVCPCFSNDSHLIELNYTAMKSKIESAVDINSVCAREGFFLVSQEITRIKLGNHALLRCPCSEV